MSNPRESKCDDPCHSSSSTTSQRQHEDSNSDERASSGLVVLMSTLNVPPTARRLSKAGAAASQRLASMCCCGLHRHQIHLISYGCVSFGLITTGLVFTVFAIFQKDSQIGKVWLAGPTTMVVGLVLCGKVIIDWGPAMMHAREGSIDSRLNEQLAQQLMLKAPPPLHDPEPPEVAKSLVLPNNPLMHSGYICPQGNVCSTRIHSPVYFANEHVENHTSSPRRLLNGKLRPNGSCQTECLVYAQYEDQLSASERGYPGNSCQGSGRGRNGIDCCEQSSTRQSTKTSSSATIVSPAQSVIETTELCDCKYGSMRRPPAPRTFYQGESFMLNERSFLI